MIETDSFTIELPDAWRVEALGKRLQITTPDDGFLMLSSTSASGPGTSDQYASIVQQLEDNALASMCETAANSELARPLGPAKEVLPSGTVFTMMTSFTHDKAYFLAQFCVRGPRTVVLATFEGPAVVGKQIGIVSNSLKKINWL